MASIDFQRNRVAVLSDVNANWEALEAVIRDMKESRIDRLVFLGDAIGFGPDPSACLNWLRLNADVYLLGGLERQLLGRNTGWVPPLPPSVLRSIEWSRVQLDEAEAGSISWLGERQFVLRQGKIIATHTANAWDLKSICYGEVNQQSFFEIRNAIGDFDLLLVGDNHDPWGQGEGRSPFRAADIKGQFSYINNTSTVVCVGSVGQPRDRDPRASYVIVTNGSLEWRRVQYNVAVTQGKIRAIPELHSRFADRLARGI